MAQGRSERSQGRYGHRRLNRCRGAWPLHTLSYGGAGKDHPQWPRRWPMVVANLTACRQRFALCLQQHSTTDHSGAALLGGFFWRRVREGRQADWRQAREVTLPGRSGIYDVSSDRATTAWPCCRIPSGCAGGPVSGYAFWKSGCLMAALHSLGEGGAGSTGCARLVVARRMPMACILTPRPGKLDPNRIASTREISGAAASARAMKCRWRMPSTECARIAKAAFDGKGRAIRMNLKSACADAA